MEKICGVNLGNWLVLEKWMDINIFAGCESEDETWLIRDLEEEKYNQRVKIHRDSFITEADFKELQTHGVNLVRIPVPYFIFGDRKPFSGCIEYLDKAFQWAEKYDIQIMIDLHTVPGSQNGYDNGGLTGVCKWSKNPEEVEFVLSVLERLAERYKDKKNLYGIEVLNEPISFLVWVTSPSFGKARDKDEAKGSSYVSLTFLKKFYLEAYQRLRSILPEDKTIIFHDGFRLGSWKKFIKTNDFKNVILDTHVYIFAMENFVPLHLFWVYKLYIGWNKRQIRNVSKYIPVVVGEWCNSNKYAGNAKSEVQQQRFIRVANEQLKAWSISAGYIYWSYQLWRDRKEPMDEQWKESWDLARCWKRGWMPTNFKNLKE